MKQQKSFKYQSNPVYYTDSGNGKPVILLHGFGEDGRIWDFQLKYLENKCRLIIPDIPGSGRSPGLSKGSMEIYAEVVNALLEHEKLDKVTLIGHSMGGYITLAFVEKYPEKVGAFGLFHSSALPDDEEKRNTRKKGIEFIREHGPAKFLEQATAGLFSPYTKQNRPALVQETIDRFNNFEGESLIQYYEAMMARPDRREILSQSKVPVLFILGKHDSAVPFDKGLEQSHLPEFSYIHVCMFSGHLGMLEEEDFCNKALEAFIAE